ncbi:MAG: hypothetical protein E7578_00515 [Ruminococcaceae bacterium]|nr:hypothetical protein [Oscillospiraceae bacterium]
MKLKRILSAFLAVVIVSAMIPFAANADEKEGIFYYSVSDGEATITNIQVYPSVEGYVVIPSALGGYPVTAIDSYAFDFSASKITGFSIPGSVRTIGNGAFSGCTSLKSIVIPDSVTFIGESVFSNCVSLKSVVIPNSITAIGENTFSGCTSLTNVTIPDSVTFIDIGAFSGCTSLTNVTIPDSVKTLGSNYFYGCFSGCTNLSEVYLGDGLEYIGSYTFSNCTSLKSITIPESVTVIGMGAFKGCTGIEKVYISDLSGWCNGFGVVGADTSPLQYGAELYLDGELVTDLIIPDDVTSIGGYAFAGCTSIKSVFIPKSVTYIAMSAFYGCENLTDVYYEATKNELEWEPWKNIKIDENTYVENIHYGVLDPYTHYLFIAILLPSCTVDGIVAASCSCGFEFEMIVPATGHQNTVVINQQDMNCYSNGYTGDTYCTDCDTVIEYGEIIPATHYLINFDSCEPTCTDFGWNSYTECLHCEYSTYEMIPATGIHTGGIATCTERAVCDTCGNEYGEIDSDKHSFVQFEGKEPTCTEDGWKDYVYCVECEYNNYVSLPATGIHTGGIATCTERAVCDTCGNEYGEINPDKHGFVEVDAKIPTCTENGWDTYLICVYCNYTTVSPIPATGVHTGGIATCVSKAVCDTCGNEYGEFDSSNHVNVELRGAKEATETENGYTGDRVCTDCGTTVTTGSVIPQLKPLAFPGDANGDGKINLTDVSMILKHIAKWSVTLDLDVADVNDDGKVNLTDASLILKFIAKWDVILK